MCHLLGLMCAARVVNLRELVVRDEAEATRHDQRMNYVWTYLRVSLLSFEMSSKELDGGTSQHEK